MATAMVDSPNSALPSNERTQMWVRVLMIWHIVLSVGGLVGVGLVWAQAASMVLWLKIVLTAVLLTLSIASAAAVININRGGHKGRVISLAINYLGLIFSILGSMHVLNLFVGLDSFADTFGRGLPYLIAAFLGFFVTGYGNRFENNPSQKALFENLGKAITALSGIAFLFAVGLLSGLQALGTSLLNGTAVLLVIGIILFGLMVWAMGQRPVADHFQATNSHGEMLSGYLFLSPNLLGFLIFFAGPLLLSLYVSFTNSDAFGNAEFIGLANYAEIFNLDFATLASPDQRASEVMDTTVYSELNRFNLFGSSYVIGAQDKLFWIALGNTLQFVLIAVPLSVVPALLLANLLNSKIPGMKFFRAIYFLPSVAAVVGISLVWQWLYNATIGYINYGITLITQLLNNIGFLATDPQIRWLSESRTALLAVIIMAAWQWIGFNTVLFLAGLQNIPKSLYEAATVDGASPRQQFWKVTLPLLGPTMFFVVTTTVIQAMQIFEQVFILIPGQNPAGPGNSTLTMVLYLYQKGFQRFEQGYASAIAWVLFLLIFGVTLYQFQRQRTSGTSYDA
ncbi:MAG: sugar ABC transporter permease [Chloroflexi bacterium]|nr:sugar ABC transporter permease [Chloroflexota bacterium]